MFYNSDLTKIMKKAIVWNEKYSTDIEEIDAQHKLVLKNLKLLIDALEAMEPKIKILELLKGLDFYTTRHFDVEEKYMIKFDYPKYNSHKVAHTNFKSIYKDIREHYHYKKTKSVYVLAIHLAYTMVDWLNYHLQHEDQELAEFLKTRIKN